MRPERYWFLGIPVPDAFAEAMADHLTIRDSYAPLGAQHVVRRRTERAVSARAAA